MDVLGENGSFNDVIYDFKGWVQAYFPPKAAK
jgi:hypothetical protein